MNTINIKEEAIAENMMEHKSKIEPIEVNGELYYTLEQFATITGKTSGHIMRMITTGNRIRKLKSKSLLSKTMVLASELEDFPFIRRGGGEITEVYHFDAAGNKTLEYIEDYHDRMAALDEIEAEE